MFNHWMHGKLNGAVFQWALGVILLAPCASVCLETAGAVAEADYATPSRLTGTIYEKAPEPRRVLFKFRRTASRSDSTVRVLREFFTPEGALATRERVVYENGNLVSCELDRVQTGAKGRMMLRSDSETGNKPKLFFEYTPHVGAKTETSSESLRKDVLLNDMVPFFVSTHWDELMKGATIKFRMIVLQRAETVGFKLVKVSETTWHGKPAVVLRMEPTSLVIAQLVDPVFFTVEKAPPHRIPQYIGRTTPLIKKGNKWEDLDAVSVFDLDP